MIFYSLSNTYVLLKLSHFSLRYLNKVRLFSFIQEARCWRINLQLPMTTLPLISVLQ